MYICSHERPPLPWHTKETFKGLIDLSQTALKGAALVNGGACVAFLSFMGRFFDGEIGQAINPTLALFYPMLLFIGGLVVAGLASGVAYIAQLCLFNEEVRPTVNPRPWHQKSDSWL